MTMLDLRLILVLCCYIQLSRLAYVPFPNVCPPEFPHQYGMSICYSINEEYLTFDEAQASCMAKGAKLAEPSRYYEENFVNDLRYPNINNDYLSFDSYWFGITDTVVPGVWTYASDNRPFISFWRFNRSNPPHGNYCITFTYSRYESTFQSVPCEQKAKYVCQYDIPLKVCGIRGGGDLIPFNTSYTMPYVQIPCDYTLASIVCGDYDVRVYGTSAPDMGMTTFSPKSARVVVQRAMTQETLVSAEVSRDAIAKSSNGKNLWTVTAGAWSTEVREDFELFRHAAVIKFGDVGQVDFSVIKDKVENGLYVRCKAVKSSAEFPWSLCGFTDGTTNWTEALQPWLKKELQIQIIMRVIFLQNASQQLQCSDIARKVRSCPNEWAAVSVCSPVFIYGPLARCVEADKLWFDICLEAHCNKDADKCKQLKTKMADCGLTISSKPPRVMQSFMALLNTC